MSVTIKQIAELANVSRGTVDKVLNDRPGVKAETKAKILQIAKELNYQPNFLGKALVQSKEPTKLGIVLTPDYNPFIQAILKGIRQATDEFSPFGLKIDVKMLTTLEAAELISILNEMSINGYSGIAVFPIDDTQVKNKINQLVDEGIRGHDLSISRIPDWHPRPLFSGSGSRPGRRGCRRPDGASAAGWRRSRRHHQLHQLVLPPVQTEGLPGKAGVPLS